MEKLNAIAGPYLPSWWTAASPGQQMDNWMCAALSGSMVLAAVVLLAGVQAPYGRYSSKTWGFLVNGKLAWVLQVRLSSLKQHSLRCHVFAFARARSLVRCRHLVSVDE